jgi:hypothetical protein
MINPDKTYINDDGGHEDHHQNKKCRYHVKRAEDWLRRAMRDDVRSAGTRRGLNGERKGHPNGASIECCRQSPRPNEGGQNFVAGFPYGRIPQQHDTRQPTHDQDKSSEQQQPGSESIGPVILRGGGKTRFDPNRRRIAQVVQQLANLRFPAWRR